MILPALRPDLQLSVATPGLDGSPQWTLADPLRGKYFMLGAPAMRLLRHWGLGDALQVLKAANAEFSKGFQTTDGTTVVNEPEPEGLADGDLDKHQITVSAKK